MSNLAVFGANGQLGRLILAESLRRGHPATAYVRDPETAADLAASVTSAGDAAPTVTVARGDVRDRADVAEAARTHDVVISSVYTARIPAADLYPAAASALLAGVGSAARLIVVGVASTREAAPGVLLMDTPGFPQEGMDFSRARAAELEVLRAAPEEVDWLLVMPPMEIDRQALAVALLDEIEAPRHHRTAIPAGD